MSIADIFSGCLATSDCHHYEKCHLDEHACKEKSCSCATSKTGVDTGDFPIQCKSLWNETAELTCGRGYVIRRPDGACAKKAEMTCDWKIGQWLIDASNNSSRAVDSCVAGCLSDSDCKHFDPAMGHCEGCR